MLSVSTLLFRVLFCIPLVQAKYNYDFSKATKDASSLEAQYVTLPVDHFSSNEATFQNRYWVNDEFYTDGGPVILFDGGESDASKDIPVLFFGQGVDMLPDYGQRFGALLILWEHRYYGDSLPEGLENIETPDELATYFQYLTFEQALEDVAVFAKNFSLSTHPNQDFRPNNVPWIFVGGSYPGVRAAFMRLRNPEVIYASLASSAPVQLQEDFWQYYIAMERKLADTSGGTGCLNDLHAFANYINTILVDRDIAAAEYLLTATGYESNTSTDNSDAAWTIRRIGLEAIAETPTGDFQYKGLDGVLGQFCSSLISPEYTNDTSVTSSQLQGGIVSFYGLNRSIEIYAQIIAIIGVEVADNATATWRSIKADRGQHPDDSDGMTIDEYAWIYQTCTEAGYFQDSNSSYPTNIIPGFVDVSSWIQDNCISNYGNSAASGPDVANLNNKYHGWHISTTNVLFINGQDDPWRALSVASDINPAEPGNTFTTTIPASGATLPNGTVFGYIIPNGVHCSDLDYNLTAVQTNTTVPGSVDENANVAHELFASALSSWLPAYTKFAAANQTAAHTASATSTPSAKSSARRESMLRSVWALMFLALCMAFLA